MFPVFTHAMSNFKCHTASENMYLMIFTSVLSDGHTFSGTHGSISDWCVK